MNYMQKPIPNRAQSVLDWISWLEWLTDPQLWSGRLRSNLPYLMPTILLHKIEDELDKLDKSMFTPKTT